MNCSDVSVHTDQSFMWYHGRKTGINLVFSHEKEPILTRLTTNLTLSPDAAIDLHMHTTYSDGRWPAEQLIEYLVADGFDMVAITDHDRVDTVAGIQELAAGKNLPVLAGVEMSTQWRGKMGHVLCYGFDPQQNELREITETVVR